jgi:hypothetical protein
MMTLGLIAVFIGGWIIGSVGQASGTDRLAKNVDAADAIHNIKDDCGTASERGGFLLVGLLVWIVGVMAVVFGN